MFHVKHEGPTRPHWEDAVPHLALSADQAAQMDRYEQLLTERAVPLGMVAASDLPRLRQRHLLDCLRGAPLLPKGLLADLGSGAGLPGLVLAIARPDVHVVLTERRRNRAAFLELAVDEIGLGNAEAHPGRAEDLVGGRFAAVSARAFADARASWAVAEPLLEPTGILLYWAGSGFDPGSEAPSGVSITVSETPFEVPGLARPGPVVIMARQ